MDTYSGQYACPVEVTIAAVGGKWKCLILWWLRRDTRRFSELKLLIPRISQKVLTQQLRELEQDGLLRRESYSESPPRVEYTLTPRGQTFTPITEMMCTWGKTHQPDYPFSYCYLQDRRVVIISPEAVSLCTRLETYNAVAIAVSAVQDLSASLLQSSPDVLLMDLTLLTDEEVHACLAKIKQAEANGHKSIAIAAILPINNPGERARAAKLGFAVHIPHPIDPIELVSTIASLAIAFKSDAESPNNLALNP